MHSAQICFADADGALSRSVAGNELIVEVVMRVKVDFFTPGIVAHLEAPSHETQPAPFLI